MKRIMVLIFLALFFIACDEVDVSKMSDEDLDRLSERLIVCEMPYIRYGGDCCLDQNDNKICDKDEMEIEVEETEEIEEVDEVELVEEIQQEIKQVVGLLMCEGQEQVDLHYLPKNTLITICEGNNIIFGTFSINVMEYKSDFVTFKVSGDEFILDAGVHKIIETTDGKIDFMFYDYSQDGQIEIRIERLTNPMSYPDKK